MCVCVPCAPLLRQKIYWVYGSSLPDFETCSVKCSLYVCQLISIRFMCVGQEVITFQMTVFINTNAFGPKPIFGWHAEYTKLFHFSMVNMSAFWRPKLRNWWINGVTPLEDKSQFVSENNWGSHTTPSFVSFRLPSGSTIGCTIRCIVFWCILMCFVYNIHDRMYMVVQISHYIYNIYIHTITYMSNRQTDCNT